MTALAVRKASPVFSVAIPQHETPEDEHCRWTKAGEEDPAGTECGSKN